MSLIGSWELLIFATGCVGAATPEVARLYKATKRRKRVSVGKVAISIMFFLLGGFVALILPAVNLWTAFYTGLSLPTIVSSVAGKPIEEKRRRPAEKPKTVHPLRLSEREHLTKKIGIRSIEHAPIRPSYIMSKTVRKGAKAKMKGFGYAKGLQKPYRPMKKAAHAKPRYAGKPSRGISTREYLGLLFK